MYCHLLELLSLGDRFFLLDNSFHIESVGVPQNRGRDCLNNPIRLDFFFPPILPLGGVLLEPLLMLETSRNVIRPKTLVYGGRVAGEGGSRAEFQLAFWTRNGVRFFFIF